MTYPNLLVIGAQKAGTTWIHKRLSDHPDVFMSEKKELDFFHRSDWRGALADYAAHFEHAGGVRYVGESSPAYMWTVEADSPFYVERRTRNAAIPEAAHATLGGDVRLIAGLRHPVDRAVSAFFHHFRRGRIPPDASILEAGRKFGIIHMGFYERHLAGWIDRFGRAALHVVLFDDLQREPAAVWAGICGFLDIEAVTVPKLAKAANIGYTLQFRDGRIRIDLESKLRQNQLAREAQAADPDAVAVPSVSLEELRALHELYRDDIAYAERAFGAGRLGWGDRLSGFVPEEMARP